MIRELQKADINKVTDMVRYECDSTFFYFFAILAK